MLIPGLPIPVFNAVQVLDYLVATASFTSGPVLIQYPIGVQGGDTLIAAVALAGNVSTPSGWTLIGNQQAPNGIRIAIIIRTYASGSSETLSTSTNTVVVTCISLRSNRPFNVAGTSFFTASDTAGPQIASSSSSPGEKPLKFAFGAFRWGSGSRNVATYPSGFDLSQDDTTVAGSARIGLAFAVAKPGIAISGNLFFLMNTNVGSVGTIIEVST